MHRNALVCQEVLTGVLWDACHIAGRPRSHAANGGRRLGMADRAAAFGFRMIRKVCPPAQSLLLAFVRTLQASAPEVNGGNIIMQCETCHHYSLLGSEGCGRELPAGQVWEAVQVRGLASLPKNFLFLLENKLKSPVLFWKKHGS